MEELAGSEEEQQDSLFLIASWSSSKVSASIKSSLDPFISGDPRFSKEASQNETL